MGSITVRVPATSANCGPGFDCLGLALTLYNTFKFTPDASATANAYTFEGFGADILSAEDPAHNLVGEAMQKVFDITASKPVYGQLHTVIEIPPSRGLGSSSTAIVAGLMLANRLAENPLSKEALLELATELEGHPDNVAPALLGNLICAVNHTSGVLHTMITIPDTMRFAVAVPDVLVATEYARSVLPQTITHKKAAINVSHATLFLTSLLQGKLENLQVAMEDFLHVPYRKELIPHCEEAFEAALLGGAYGTTISGSGSTLIAYCNDATVTKTARLMGDVFTANGIACQTYTLPADTEGAVYID